MATNELQKIYEERQKQLSLSKKGFITFQSQYEALNKKLNEKSQHRVNNYYPIQSAIEKIQIENRELQKKIFEIKNHNIKQSKELVKTIIFFIIKMQQGNFILFTIFHFHFIMFNQSLTIKAIGRLSMLFTLKFN